MDCEKLHSIIDWTILRLLYDILYSLEFIDYNFIFTKNSSKVFTFLAILAFKDEIKMK